MSPPLAGLLPAVVADPLFAELVAAAGAPTYQVTGPASIRPFVAALLAAPKPVGGADVPVLLVTATGREAEQVAATCEDLLGVDRVELFPSWETLPHERLSPRADTVGRRLAVLRRIAHPEEHPAGPVAVLVTTVRSMIQPLAPGLGELVPVRIAVGDEHDLADLTAQLVLNAYSRVDLVTKRGEMAVRGGILDVFPPTAEHPYRVEFWGDEVSDIRTFAVTDQRSIQTVKKFEAPPCREILLTDDVRKTAGQLSASAGADPTIAEMLTKLSEGIAVEGMEALIPALVRRSLVLLPELLPAGTHVVLADPERIRTRAIDLERTGAEFLAASWAVAASGGKAPIDLGTGAYRHLEEVFDAVRDNDLTLWRVAAFGDGELPAEPRVLPAPQYRGELQPAINQTAERVHRGGTVVFVVPGAGTAERTAEQLRAADLGVALAADGLTDPPKPGLVTVTRGRLDSGLSLPATDLTIVTEGDLLGSRGATSGNAVKMPSRRRNAVDPLALKPGDHVVHNQHGIGRFVELVQRTTGAAVREYLVVEYAPSKRGHPGDRLFVPSDALDQLSRYVGGELPTLNKLGGGDWAKTKTNARRAVRQIAAKLVQLYAARASSPGHRFGPDTPWQRELEDAFPYTETPDQLAAIDEVKADMEKSVPMDRVISGDVGYGKTEIAVRAAFKAVQDGKQVVVLVPTTLLAQQHLATFTLRMASFPVTVRGLSRFSSDNESKKTIAGLADGSVDIVIGTHRLLQPSVVYKDLGLVIVDEEQRFGVEHKEFITQMRAHVDILTMSATPIPRTLEMSLAGIREMSTITTPPEDRHPILTYVGQYDDKLVAAAIRRELLRDGQVFLVHNRVSDINKIAARIKELVPEASVAVGHGQLGEHALERVIDGFWKRETDVLVCTTIVETGLDISNANTLIINHAEVLGLSQMHQLRGRVGRGRERGYAYFLYPPDKALTETALDRLNTIASNSDLGSGMAVAMKDLEIRGAGSILGAEQSGHIAGVGFDLYLRLVGEAVTAFKKQAGPGSADEEPEEIADVRVELPVDANLPHEYIPSDVLRLDAYRKIADAATVEAIEAVRAELIDRFGPIPPEAEALLAVADLRRAAREVGITDITTLPLGIRFAPVDVPESIQMRLHRLYPGMKLNATSKALTLKAPAESDRIGAAMLRDRAILDWAHQVLDSLRPRVPAAR